MTKRKLFIPEGYEEDYIRHIRQESKYIQRKSQFAEAEIPPLVPKWKPTLMMYNITDEIQEKNKQRHSLYDKIGFYVFLFISLIIIYKGLCTAKGFSSFIGILLHRAFICLIFVGGPVGAILSIKTGVDKRIEKYNRHLEAWKYWYELYPRKKVISYWKDLSGYKFEKELAQIFIKNGFDTEITKKSGDGGVDIILNPKGEKIYIQCKAYKTRAGVAVVRELLGCMELNNVEYGIVACTGGFTKGAIEAALMAHITLLDSSDIVKLMDKDIPLDYFYRKE
ncbi:MAG: restriction endonuclease [Alphaproteobacteria bacterium]|nr:restriction endonuclease [Alphaproteobacteria bacterium]